MAWNEDSKKLVFQLFEAGQAERTIVRELADKYKSDDKTVRRCLAGLVLVKANLDARPTSQTDQDRFERLAGTPHYLRELERLYEAHKRPTPLTTGLDHERHIIEHIPSSVLDFSGPMPSLGSGAEVQVQKAPDVASAYWRYEHIKELSCFGQWLGERLKPYVLKELVRGSVVNQDNLWLHKPDVPSGQPRDQAESKVERDWGVGRYNAREHPLFEYFQQHLPGHPCWSVLEQVAQSYQQQREAWHQADAEVSHRVKTELVDLSLSDEDAQSIASSLMKYAYHGGNLVFAYTLDNKMLEGRVYWYLKLRNWNVGIKEDPEELNPVIEMHQRLVEEVLSWRAIQTFSQKDTHARAQTAEFKRHLRHEPQLLKLLLESRCDWCRSLIPLG